MNYELKHIRGIPYYIRDGAAYSFELDPSGAPSSESIRLGIYDTARDCVVYDADWRERSQPRLDAYRTALVSQKRDSLRQTLTKPQKSSHSKRAPRKTPARAKNPKSS
jgi:hypothetical protein